MDSQWNDSCLLLIAQALEVDPDSYRLPPTRYSGICVTYHTPSTTSILPDCDGRHTIMNASSRDTDHLTFITAYCIVPGIYRIPDNSATDRSLYVVANHSKYVPEVGAVTGGMLLWAAQGVLLSP